MRWGGGVDDVHCCATHSPGVLKPGNSWPQQSRRSPVLVSKRWVIFMPVFSLEDTMWMTRVCSLCLTKTVNSHLCRGNVWFQQCLSCSFSGKHSDLFTLTHRPNQLLSSSSVALVRLIDAVCLCVYAAVRLPCHWAVLPLICYPQWANDTAATVSILLRKLQITICYISSFVFFALLVLKTISPLPTDNHWMYS